MKSSETNLVSTPALIPALSPAERELEAMRFLNLVACPANPAQYFRERRRTFLPLLGGEGQGEGEHTTNCLRDFQSLRCSADVSPARANKVGAQLSNFETLAPARSPGRRDDCPALAA